MCLETGTLSYRLASDAIGDKFKDMELELPPEGVANVAPEPREGRPGKEANAT